jgi:hypothetical protein
MVVHAHAIRVLRVFDPSGLECPVVRLWRQGDGGQVGGKREPGLSSVFSKPIEMLVQVRALHRREGEAGIGEDGALGGIEAMGSKV